MRDKDIEKLLSDGAKDVLPDDRVKQNIKSSLGYDENKAQKLAIVGGGEAVSCRRRNIIIAACAAALAVILAICFIVPAIIGRDNPFGHGGITDGNKFDGITDANSFYAYGAASVGTMLSSRTSSGGEVAALAYGGGSGTQDGQDREGQIETINRYMSLVESLLSDSAIVGSAIGGAEGYDYGMTVSYKDLLGGTVSYTMYYDKIFLNGEVDDGEREEEYSISGVLIVDGNIYPVEGSYESEVSSDETGDELEFRAYTSFDRRSYIEVRQEYESETEGGAGETEKEYVYTVVSDGRQSEKTEVKYEQEDGETELELIVESDGIRDELKFTGNSSGGEGIILAEGRLNGRSVRFRVRVTQGQYRYEFEDGTSSDFDRHDDEDDDDRRRMSL